MKTPFNSTPITVTIGALAVFLAAAGARAAAPQIAETAMVPRLSIQSDLGITNQIQYTSDLSQSNWVTLTNLLVGQSPYWFVDAGAPPAAQRFYRVVALVSTNPSAPDNMALIPAGSFTMGDTFSEGDSQEHPAHLVSLSAFFFDLYPVTKSLWGTVTGWNSGNGYSYNNPGSGKASTHPVQTVSWYDAVKWCNARSQMENLTPCYYTDADLTAVYKTGQVEPFVNWTAKGYRLPTEAEWEKAARGGAGGHRFPWADANTISHSRANYSSSSSFSYDLGPESGYHPAFSSPPSPYTSPVDYFAPNGYGLYDMAGNVLEWCWDWYRRRLVRRRRGVPG